MDANIDTILLSSMTDQNDISEFMEDDLPKSKSQLKRDSHALQEMGARLTKLKPDQLERLPMSDRLRAAIAESQRIKKHEAIRRHMQLIGKIMRAEQQEAIKQLLDEMDSGSQAHAQKFHLLERWRDRLLHEGPEALTEYLAEYPQADHQHLRQLVRNAMKDEHEQKNRGSSKKLFRYLKDLQESDEAAD
jgi:ribosome-associated protein